MCECPSNITPSMPSELHLMGLSWIQDKSLWMAVPLTMMYSVSCTANCALILAIMLERSLHKPVYIYISVMGLVDLTLSASVIPKVLAILWFGASAISAEACLLQMFLFFSIEAVEVSLFTLMSYDRYGAICHPLRYTTIITNAFTIKSALIFITRNMILLSALPYLTVRLQYCKSNVNPSIVCEHLSVIKLACGDVTPNNVYMLALVCIHCLGDCGMMGMSYLLILRVVLRLRSMEARKKAFSTCSSHIIVIVFFVLACIFSFLVYIIDSNAPLYVQTMSTILIGLVPPMINPIVFGVRMKEIRQGLKKLTIRLQQQML